MKQVFLIIFGMGLTLHLYAQQEGREDKFTPAIEDNSFFIEESYNQEERVVQHISNLYYTASPSHDLMYTFTQEWPLYKYMHQISYTIPYSWLDGNSARGIGDVLINYRYQLFYKSNWACVSPRLSLILPTGDYKRGLGYGTTGLQFNLPISKRLTNFWVVHLNAGATFLHNARTLAEDGATLMNTLWFYNAGGSVIWLTGPNFNLMLEGLENFTSQVDPSGQIQLVSQFILNPGLRFAINDGGLQIVPGISVPLSFSGQTMNPGLFFYLSFEHPY